MILRVLMLLYMALPPSVLRADDALDTLKADLSSGDRARTVAAISKVEARRLKPLYENVYQAFRSSRDNIVRSQALFLMLRCTISAI